MDTIFAKNAYPASAALPLLLPSMHSTDFYHAEAILRQSMLQITPCPVFGDKRLYFFYGKPAYDVGARAGNRIDDLYYPVCFVVDTRNIYIDHVYPFDTGAYDAGKGEGPFGFMHRGMAMEHFALEPGTTSIRQFIADCFGTNENYIKGEPLSRPVPPESHARSLYNLQRACGEFGFDERALTIEIATRDNLLLADCLRAIVVPDSMARSAQFSTMVQERHPGVKVDCYTTRRLTAPSKYYGVVFDKVMDYLEGQQEVLYGAV